jgi:hypothetical protein
VNVVFHMDRTDHPSGLSIRPVKWLPSQGMYTGLEIIMSLCFCSWKPCGTEWNTWKSRLLVLQRRGSAKGGRDYNERTSATIDQLSIVISYRFRDRNRVLTILRENEGQWDGFALRNICQNAVKTIRRARP